MKKRVLLPFLFVVTFSYGAIASESIRESEAAIVKMAKETSGQLDSSTCQRFEQLLSTNSLLDSPRIEANVLNAIGKLLPNCNVDDAFQKKIVDDSGLLWERIGIDVDPEGFAYLSDQIEIAHGRPQRFASFPQETADGHIQCSDQASRADSERDRIGLDSVESHCNLLKRAKDNGKDIRAQTARPLSSSRVRNPNEPEVRRQLLLMKREDQAARALPDHRMSEDERARFAQGLEDVDKKNLPQITKIFDRYGFMNVRQVGRSGVEAEFLLIQHAVQNPGMMKGALLQAKALMDRGDLPRVYYALLSDRVACLINGEPQLYGTQPLHLTKSGCTISDPEQLNQRRATMRMAPLSHR